MTKNDQKSFGYSPPPIATRAAPLTAQHLPPWVFAKVVNQLTIPVCLTDTAANILYVNQAFTEVTGFIASEVVGKSTAVLSDPSTPTRVYDQMWRQIRRGEPWTGLLVNRRQGDTVYLAELSVIPVQDEQAELACFLGIYRDVTAMHHLEQQVHYQKALIESMVDAAPAIIALLDENGRVILDNHEYKKLVGDLRVREPAAEFLRALRESLGENFPWGADADSSFRDQEISFDPGNSGQPRWFSCSGVWFRERASTAATFFKPVRQTWLLLMANEITALKRQQEAVGMNAMRALLAEQERVRSMREALQAAIFQMQGPLNLMTAAHDLLTRRGTQADPALRQALRQATAAGQAALERLRALIPVAPLETVAPINVNQLLREVLELDKQRLLAGGMIVDWKPTPILPAITAPVSRLRSMFKHLIDNALDAMEGNRQEPRELRIATRVQEEAVVVIIEDTGPGIPTELRWQIFEPFFTTKRAATHVGLGLALVQEVVNEQRGVISLDPDYLTGCRWRIALPLHYDDDS
ncbi:MAG: nitrogen fixation negative regulator NifL [Candidatus Contendobacter sp.]|nr:nitrogen fixation negative regulator NifL [Gammaproteobacteria bacterium]MCC8995019.1 nitrogen fixation negative regulator NifL [Candidatus Contendobacter sp.]